jgi:N-acetyl-anhydromuramyl-L-alanine amidase AmpD
MLGLHLPNRPFQGDDWERIKALGVRHFVDLHYWPDRWRQIKAEIPGAVIHARVDVRGPLGNPREEAQQLTDLVHEHGAYVDDWRWRNEPNLESRGETPGAWQQYLREFGRALSDWLRSRVAVPAVSPGTQDWLRWLEASVVGARQGGLSILDAHAYGVPEQIANVLWEHRRRWDGRIICTESNPSPALYWTENAWADDIPLILGKAQEQTVESVCLYIWEWANPDSQISTSVDVRRYPAVQAAIREAAKARATAPAPADEKDAKGGQTVSASPNHGGKRAQTLGIVLHSTRGGANDLTSEYQAAVRWLCNPASGVSAHVVVGPNGEVARLVDPDLVAWHARELNNTHLGIELAQSREGQAIPEACLAAAAQVVAEWCRRYDLNPGKCVEHTDTAPGRRDGKTDIGAPFSTLAFVQRVQAVLAGPQIDWEKVGEYARWSLARIQAREDPRDVKAFVTHLNALGADWRRPELYGLPA